ncbi:MAG: acetyl-CoA carboxylase biotin carboxyl carrier protein [Hyphomicrobiaceae bacterium]
MADSKDIADIIRALVDSGFADAEVHLDDLYIRVSSRPPDEGVRPDQRPLLTESRADASKTRSLATEAAARNAPADPPPARAAGEEGTLRQVRSPTLGTFYRAPSPGAPPFVNVGDRIEVGKPVGLVEVMKLFNTIESDVSGTVVELHAENGQLVEFDQPLMTIRTA